MKDNNFDLIEAYLFGQMTEEEAKAFEQAVSRDAELARALEQQRMEHRGMHLLFKKDLVSNLEAWKQEQFSSTQPAKRSGKIVPMRKRILQIAIAACIIGLLGWFVNFWLGQSDSVNIAGQYFDKSSDGVRSGTRTNSENLTLASEKMQPPNPDYRSALAYIEAEKDSINDEVALFMKGECYFRLKEYTLAEAVFQTIIQGAKSKASRQKAEWHLMLTYLSAGGKDDSKFQALHSDIIGNTGHAFHREAVTLQKQL